MMRLVLMSMFAVCAWAQLKFDIHPVVGRASDRLKDTQRVLQVAHQSVWRDARKPEELAIVDGVAKTYRAHFLPELGSAPRIATLTEKGQDILVARWTAASDSPYSELIVWDTPESTSFIFKLPGHSWSSDPAIRSTFESMLPFPGADVWPPRPKGVALNIARDAQTQRWIGAGALLITSAPRQFDVGSMNWIDLWETATASYPCATFSQYATYEYPHSMRIPERFPPLESRVEKWTKQRILDELSREPEHLDPTHPLNGVQIWERADKRDRVLARELVRRDLTDEELFALLLSRRSNENGAVLQAIVDAGEVGRYSSTIRAFLQVDRGGFNGKRLTSPGFAILRRANETNFTDIAIQVLRQEIREDDAFQYAAEHGTTAADYRALKELPRLREVFMSSRDYALAGMRKRLGLDEDGNPVTAK